MGQHQTQPKLLFLAAGGDHGTTVASVETPILACWRRSWDNVTYSGEPPPWLLAEIMGQPYLQWKHPPVAVVEIMKQY